MITGQAVIRLANFMALFDHALRGREMKNFNKAEIMAARELIVQHADKDLHAYVKMLNRLVITDTRVRESKRTQLWGCILEAATAESIPKKRRA